MKMIINSEKTKLGRKVTKRLASFVLSVLLLVLCIPNISDAKKWDVVRGEIDYAVVLDETSDLFLCNKGSIGHKVGTEFYLTYTVESIKAEKFHGDGVLGTNQPAASYPYVDSEDGTGGGVYHYSVGNKLLKEGRTYFVKFTITEDGYTYRAAWTEDEGSGYIRLSSTVGTVKKDSEYFGVWFSHHKMTGKLTRVRFYDKEGNDLGVQATRGRNVAISREQTFEKDQRVDHRYTVEIANTYNIAISNKELPIGNTVYMEYKVKSSKSQVFQVGGILSNNPQEVYPYEKEGYLVYESVGEPKEPKTVSDGPLLTEGAEYIIIFERKSDYMDVIIQKTYKGEKSIISLGYTYGEYDSKKEYFSLWFAGGETMLMNAVLENFKCYDASGNNLGIQCNRESVGITHYGELEDYSDCEAMYYSKKADSFYVLYADKTLKYIKDNKAQEGTYKIAEGTMTVSLAGKKREYKYKYLYLQDDTGEKYDRLRSYKVRFETGGGTKIEPQIVNVENGYRAKEPDKPTLKDNEFLGWYTADGEEYLFDEIITESVTLYAKWSNAEYTLLSGNIVVQPYIYIGVGIAILCVCIVVSILIIKKGKDHGKK